MKRFLSKLVPALSGVGGLFMVVGLSVVLQKPPPEKQAAEEVQAISFDVAAPPPPSPKPKPRPKPQSKPKAPPPPTPLMNSSLTGLQFGIDALQSSDAGADSTELLSRKEDVVMTEGTVDVPPQPIYRAMASYPKRARRQGVEGHVTLSLLIDDKGSVQDVMVVEAIPNGVFEQSAVQAVKEWRFNPGEYEGDSVSVRMTQTLRFQLGA